MTDSIPLSAIPDESRRDQWGRYLVVPPHGGKPTGYTRVTTVAKTLDSGGGLADWRATMTMTGAFLRPGLHSRWEALMMQHNGNPWYGSEQSKKACKVLVKECADVGGANDRKEIGSSLHTITALVDAGLQPTHLTDETERDLKAYQHGLQAHGVTVLPDFIERLVVLDKWMVAGMFDRLVEVPGFDLPLIADLKTGADLSYSWQAIAVQQAGYSRADALYEQGPAKDGSEDKRTPMPKVNQEVGMILWLNAGTGQLELHLVDLRTGWEAFERSVWVREYRSRKNLAKKFEHQSVDTQVTETSSSESHIDLDEPGLLEQLTHSVIQAHADRDTTPQLRGWLQLRVNAIGENQGARQHLIRAWPPDLPTLRSSQDHTRDQLAVIAQLLDDIEGQWELPFPPPAPPEVQEEDEARILRMFPGTTTNNNQPEGAA